MVVAAPLHHRLRLLPRIPIATLPGGNHPRSSQYDVVLSMRFGLTRDFPPRVSFAYHSITSVHSPRSRQQTSTTSAAMATKSGNPVQPAEENTQKENMEKKASLPPPPEKPEPGDCCGSGCVRCVWDVYYEELEEYNKLCTSISAESKND